MSGAGGSRWSEHLDVMDGAYRDAQDALVDDGWKTTFPRARGGGPAGGTFTRVVVAPPWGASRLLSEGVEPQVIWYKAGVADVPPGAEMAETREIGRGRMVCENLVGEVSVFHQSDPVPTESYWPVVESLADAGWLPERPIARGSRTPGEVVTRAVVAPPADPLRILRSGLSLMSAWWRSGTSFVPAGVTSVSRWTWDGEKWSTWPSGGYLPAMPGTVADELLKLLADMLDLGRSAVVDARDRGNVDAASDANRLRKSLETDFVRLVDFAYGTDTEATFVPVAAPDPVAGTPDEAARALTDLFRGSSLCLRQAVSPAAEEGQYLTEAEQLADRLRARIGSDPVLRQPPPPT